MQISALKQNTETSAQLIRWKQVIALLLLDFAVAVSWIAYHEFQPKVLELFQFNHILLEFTVIQGIIIVLTPIIAGYLADKLRVRTGNNLGLVNIGITIVSLIFMAVALSVFTTPDGILRWILPVLIVGWLISMNIFRSPAMSMIESFVPQNQLPKVIAIFILVLDLAYALEPSIVDLLNFIGGPMTFVVGGVLVFTTGFYLRSAFKANPALSESEEFNNDTANGQTSWLKIFVYTLGMALASGFIFKRIPDIIAVELPEDFFVSSNVMVSLALGFSALMALIIGYRIKAFEVGKYYIIGFLMFVVGVLGMYFLPGIFGLLSSGLLIALSFALLSVCTLPLVLYYANSQQTVMAIGVFYGIGELFESILEVYQVIN